MDPFRQVFLDQVKLATSKDASIIALYELLKTAMPSLKLEDVSVEPIRKKSFKTLQLRIHPDKHPGGDTTKLYQDVLAFYDACCDSLRRGGAPRKASPNSPPTSTTDFPQDFHIQDKWAFLDNLSIHNPSIESLRKCDLTALTVARCVSARGAIAHGQKTERSFPTDRMRKFTSVQAALDFNGGTKFLSSVDAIKEELVENGPVVSTDFILHRSLLSAGENSTSFLPSLAGKRHELLIVGWKLTAFGEVWLVHPLNGQMDPIRIAFGQFGVDDCCLAPKNSFESTKWQGDDDETIKNLQMMNGWVGVEWR